jgi:hypothetical protein
MIAKIKGSYQLKISKNFYRNHDFDYMPRNKHKPLKNLVITAINGRSFTKFNEFRKHS